MLYNTFPMVNFMTKSDPNTLTLSEFADFLSVHYLTARKYCNNHMLDEFGAYRLPSGYWRIPRSGAEKFKASLIPSNHKTPRNSPKKTAKRPTSKR